MEKLKYVDRSPEVQKFIQGIKFYYFEHKAIGGCTYERHKKFMHDLLESTLNKLEEQYGQANQQNQERPE